MVTQARKSIKQTPAAAYRERMRLAKEALKGVGETKVLQLVAQKKPELDTLTNALRWHRAWALRVADVEITETVEQVAKELGTKKPSSKLKRQGLSV